MKKLIWSYGIYAGIILIVLGLFNWFVIAPTMGYNPSQIFGYLSMVIALLSIPLGIKYFKEKINEGEITFVRAFEIGLGITSIPSVIMFLYSSLFFVFAGDDFLEWYQSTLSPEEWEQVQAQMAAMPEYLMSPWFQGLVMLITVFIVGTIITLISALILKR